MIKTAKSNDTCHKIVTRFRFDLYRFALNFCQENVFEKKNFARGKIITEDGNWKNLLFIHFLDMYQPCPNYVWAWVCLCSGKPNRKMNMKILLVGWRRETASGISVLTAACCTRGSFAMSQSSFTDGASTVVTRHSEKKSSKKNI